MTVVTKYSNNDASVSLQQIAVEGWRAKWEEERKRNKKKPREEMGMEDGKKKKRVEKSN